jgi:hypothetical protein
MPRPPPPIIACVRSPFRLLYSLMSPRTFFYPVLDSLSDGRIIRKSIALALRVMGVLVVLGALAGVIVMLKQAFGPSVPTEQTLGAVVFSLLLLAGSACLAQICIYRAASVGGLGDSPFTVIPIVSILCRWLGEIYATLLVTFAIGGCVFIWVSDANPLWILGSLGSLAPSFTPPVSSSFLAGLLWLVYFALAAFVTLVLAYFLAEGSLLLVEIAQDVRALAAGKAPMAVGVAAASASAPAPIAPVPPA